MVRVKGLEPPLRKELDPKSSASTNSATSARFRGCKDTKYNLNMKTFPQKMFTPIDLGLS